MTATEIYDWLVKKGVQVPAVGRFGDKCIVGVWVELGEIGRKDVILRTKTRAVEVIVSGDTWDEVWSKLDTYMGYGDSGADSAPHGEAV